MYTEDYSNFSLLTNSTSRGPNINPKRTIFVICVLTVPILIFFVTYMTYFVYYQKVVYPKTFTFNEVPQQLLHRAILYNNVTNLVSDYNTNTFQIKSKYKSTTHDFRVVCYYNFPNNNERNALKADTIDPFLCTHINLAFVGLRNNSLHLNQFELGVLKDLIALKEANGELKVLLSVGGAANGDHSFDLMVLNHANRKTFIQSVLNFVKNLHIDGIDLDWEFPNEEPGKDKHQRMHFTQLLEEFRKCINKQEDNHKFLLTVAVAAPVFIVDNSYDVLYMNDYVDFVNVMTYDYHFYTTTTPFTGLNAPLYSTGTEKLYLATLNINYTANYWLYKGMDSSKIVIGLPTYGHSFQLRNSRNNGLYAPVQGYGRLGSDGFADYAQICKFLAANQISPMFDMDSKSPYATKFYEWISFDDEQSLSYKAEYIRQNQFGGAMIYSLNADDHKGLCSKGTKKFPLVNVIKGVLN